MNNISFAPRQPLSGIKKDQTQKVKLLLLDDEERIVNTLRALFRFKYDVYTATNGFDALKILQDHKDIAVVISDQRMPEMTGVDFLRKAKKASPDTVRILLTGFSDLQAIIGSINDGEVFRFLNKPWSNEKIQAVVEDAVSVYTEITKNTETPEAPVPHKIIEKNIVLIKCKDQKLFQLIQDGYRDSSTNLVHVTTQAQALEVFEKNAVKVLVSSLDDTGDSQDESTFLKLLKQELPELIAIGLATQEGADYQEIIRLINEAKIYRYLILPCRPERLHEQIKFAIDMANRIYANPVLLKQQSVVRINLNETDTPTLNKTNRSTIDGTSVPVLDAVSAPALDKATASTLDLADESDESVGVTSNILAKIRSLKSFWKK